MDSITLGQLSVWNHPVKNPKARVLIIHGMSEHSERHMNTVEWLTKEEYSVVRFDLRGSGRSGGRKQWIEKFSDYVDDTITVHNWIQRELDPLPLIVLGHSLGGAIAIHFAATYSRALKGLILSAPAYLVGAGVSPLTIAVGKVLAKVAPTVRIPKATDCRMISRDQSVVTQYENDPLSYHFNTLQQGDQILKALTEIPKLASKILTPTLLVHGTGDQIIRLEGSFEILKGLGSKDRELYIAPHCYHELHNELADDRLNYFRALSFWLSRTVSKNS